MNPAAIPPQISEGRAACADHLDIVDAAYDSGSVEAPAVKYMRRYLCPGCPIRSGCQDYAMLIEQGAVNSWGVWGSTTPRERRKARRVPRAS